METTTTHKPKEGTMQYFFTGQTIPGHGVVEAMTSTGYLLVGGGFVSFVRLNPPAWAEPLVELVA